MLEHHKSHIVSLVLLWADCKASYQIWNQKQYFQVRSIFKCMCDLNPQANPGMGPNIEHVAWDNDCAKRITICMFRKKIEEII